MKLLSYLLFARPGLVVEPKLDERFQPDLAVVGSDGKVSLWVDCGYLAFEKVDKILVRHRQAQLVLVKETVRQRDSFRANCLKKTDRAEGEDRLVFLAFDDNFVAARAASLGHRQHLSLLERTPEVLRLSWEGEEVSSRLHRVTAAK